MHTWVEINTKNILNNLKAFRRLIGKKKLLLPVVKSNAYGHGIIEVSKLIDNSKLANKIAVVSGEEAILLKKNNIKISVLILSYWTTEQAKKLKTTNTEFVVYSLNQAKILNSFKKNIKVHLKVDTGTSRLGIPVSDFISFVKKITTLPYLKIESIFTHYANSEEDNNYTRQQTKKLENIEKKLNKLNIKTNYHAACSAACISNINNHFDGLRLGLSLYGYWPSAQSFSMAKKNYPWLKLKPALTWKTKIIQVKTVPKNTFIGYGCSYRTKQKIKLAVLPVGYNEGYNRLLSNKGQVIIKKTFCPVIGRICMNLTMVDVSKIKNIKVGDKVILLGKEISAENIAAKTKTINYNILTNINPNIKRIYI